MNDKEYIPKRLKKGEESIIPASEAKKSIAAAKKIKESKKAKVAEFIKKAIAKRRANISPGEKEHKEIEEIIKKIIEGIKTAKNYYDARDAVSKEMVTLVPKVRLWGSEYGSAGQAKEMLDEIFIYLNNKREEELEIKDTYRFSFSVEAGGVSDATGLEGFEDEVIRKTKGKETKKYRETIARKVLKHLFPTATRYDALALSVLTSPRQIDGGVQLSLVGKTVKGSLIYEEVDNPNTPILRDATKKSLKE